MNDGAHGAMQHTRQRLVAQRVVTTLSQARMIDLIRILFSGHGMPVRGLSPTVFCIGIGIYIYIYISRGHFIYIHIYIHYMYIYIYPICIYIYIYQEVTSHLGRGTDCGREPLWGWMHKCVLRYAIKFVQFLQKLVVLNHILLHDIKAVQILQKVVELIDVHRIWDLPLVVRILPLSWFGLDNRWWCVLETVETSQKIGLPIQNHY